MLLLVLFSYLDYVTIYLYVYVKNGKNSEGLYPEGIRVMVRKETKKKIS